MQFDREAIRRLDWRIWPAGATWSPSSPVTVSPRALLGAIITGYVYTLVTWL